MKRFISVVLCAICCVVLLPGCLAIDALHAYNQQERTNKQAAKDRSAAVDRAAVEPVAGKGQFQQYGDWQVARVRDVDGRTAVILLVPRDADVDSTDQIVGLHVSKDVAKVVQLKKTLAAQSTEIDTALQPERK